MANVFEQLMSQSRDMVNETSSVERKVTESRKIPVTKIKLESRKIFEEEDLDVIDDKFSVDMDNPENDEVVLVIDPELPAEGEEEPEVKADEMVGDMVYKCPVCGANYLCDHDHLEEEGIEVDDEGTPIACPICGDESDQILVGEIAPAEEVKEEDETELPPQGDETEEVDETEEDEVIEDSVKRRPRRIGRRFKTESKKRKKVFKLKESNVKHPTTQELSRAKFFKNNPYDGQFSSEEERDEYVKSYEKKIAAAEKGLENKVQRDRGSYGHFHRDKDRIGYMYDRLGYMKSAKIGSTESKKSRKVEAYGGLDSGNPNYLYYRGNLRGYKFSDGTALTIGSFSGFGWGATYEVQVWNENEEIIDRIKQTGSEIDAEDWIRSASKKFDSASDFIDDDYYEDDYYDDDDYYEDDYYEIHDYRNYPAWKEVHGSKTESKRRKVKEDFEDDVDGVELVDDTMTADEVCPECGEEPCVCDADGDGDLDIIIPEDEEDKGKKVVINTDTLEIDEIRLERLMNKFLHENYKGDLRFKVKSAHQTRKGGLRLEYVILKGKKEFKKGSLVSEKLSRIVNLFDNSKVFTEASQKNPEFVLECRRVKNIIVPVKLSYDFKKKVNESVYRVKGSHSLLENKRSK